jgi:hypothetical protein
MVFQHMRDFLADVRRSATVAAWFTGVTLVLSAFHTSLVCAQTTQDITLTWTAPGDDGAQGTATRYDLRYRTVGISNRDTLAWWNAATAVSGLPAPGPSGGTDTFTVRGLSSSQTYYFIIRAADEASNWSGFSNVAVRAPGVDTVPPAQITDLEVLSTMLGEPPASRPRLLRVSRS